MRGKKEADDPGEVEPGIIIHDEPGESVNGVDLPAGSVEIVASQVEHSDLEQTDGSQSGSDD